MSLHDLVKKLDSGDAIKEAIATGANIDEADKLKRTPVHMAAWCGNLEALQIFVRANAKLDAKAMDGFTPLHFAAQSSAESAHLCIRFLVKKNKSLLNMRITKGNKSALHLAVAKGNIAAVTALLEIGADILAKTTSGQSPMDLAKSPEMKALLGEGTGKTTSKCRDISTEDQDLNDIEIRETTKDVSNLSQERVDIHNNDSAGLATVTSSTTTGTTTTAGSIANASEPCYSAQETSRKRPLSEVAEEGN